MGSQCQTGTGHSELWRTQGSDRSSLYHAIGHTSAIYLRSARAQVQWFIDNHSHHRGSCILAGFVETFQHDCDVVRRLARTYRDAVRRMFGYFKTRISGCRDWNWWLIFYIKCLTVTLPGHCYSTSILYWVRFLKAAVQWWCDLVRFSEDAFIRGVQVSGSTRLWFETRCRDILEKRLCLSKIDEILSDFTLEVFRVEFWKKFTRLIYESLTCLIIIWLTITT